VNGWNASLSDHSRIRPSTNTSLVLATADVPFFTFLGKAKFSFFSNDTTVLGVVNEQDVRKAAQRPSAEAEAEDVHLDYKEFGGEMTFSLFNYNYDTSTRAASNPRIHLMREGFGAAICEECYMYAGKGRFRNAFFSEANHQPVRVLVVAYVVRH
jgi:hypothetical protein